ncbi:hypothetical protein B7C42_06055 [Nocardia cerradoensis]|uniref:Uncharacterized protein n=1 Tax=Nocardia cerradoensis TaxID=85688 RepID=A0A231GYL2_9NOCA|nr:hypothetical protein B7C42_06055 [Nocardia cerradoensis]
MRRVRHLGQPPQLTQGVIGIRGGERCRGVGSEHPVQTPGQRLARRDERLAKMVEPVLLVRRQGIGARGLPGHRLDSVVQIERLRDPGDQLRGVHCRKNVVGSLGDALPDGVHGGANRSHDHDRYGRRQQFGQNLPSGRPDRAVGGGAGSHRVVGLCPGILRSGRPRIVSVDRCRRLRRSCLGRNSLGDRKFGGGRVQWPVGGVGPPVLPQPVGLGREIALPDFGGNLEAAQNAVVAQASRPVHGDDVAVLVHHSEPAGRVDDVDPVDDGPLRGRGVHHHRLAVVARAIHPHRRVDDLAVALGERDESVRRRDGKWPRVAPEQQAPPGAPPRSDIVLRDRAPPPANGVEVDIRIGGRREQNIVRHLTDLLPVHRCRRAVEDPPQHLIDVERSRSGVGRPVSDRTIGRIRPRIGRPSRQPPIRLARNGLRCRSRPRPADGPEMRHGSVENPAGGTVVRELVGQRHGRRRVLDERAPQLM